MIRVDRVGGRRMSPTNRLNVRIEFLELVLRVSIPVLWPKSIILGIESSRSTFFLSSHPLRLELRKVISFWRTYIGKTKSFRRRKTANTKLKTSSLLFLFFRWSDVRSDRGSAMAEKIGKHGRIPRRHCYKALGTKSTVPKFVEMACFTAQHKEPKWLPLLFCFAVSSP